MNIKILQHDITWANPKENIKHLNALIDSQKGADLYVLTEMFSTGFATQPEVPSTWLGNTWWTC